MNWMDSETENYIPDNVVELTDIIERKFEEKPKDGRKKKLLSEWKNDINTYIKKCNKLAGYKMYNVVKL